MSELKKLKQQVQDGKAPKTLLVNKRVNICNVCPHLVKFTRQCSKCLCFVDLKAKLIEQNCPDDKW